MIRVVVAGAEGRMGRVIVQALRGVVDLELVGTLERADDAEAVLERLAPQVLVDFTVADASRVLGPLAARRGIAPVIGTSGLDDEDIAVLGAACERSGVGGLLVSNFSLGAVVQMRLAEEAARHLPCTGVIETHHKGKRDLPSGTAKATVQRLRAASRREIPIQSERGEDAVARQEVRFAATGETLQLVHTVSDRRAYLPGLLLAVRSVQALPGLVVGLDGLLFQRR